MKHIGKEWNKAPEVIGIDLTDENAAGLLATIIDEKLEKSTLNIPEQATILKLTKDAIDMCEPKFRSLLVNLLLEEFHDEALSGKEFRAYGFKMCIQQVPTYDYQNDVKEAKMAAELEVLRKRCNAKAKALKGYREGLVVEKGLTPTDIDYRLRIMKK